MNGYIYIRANSSDGMIDDLNSNGILATDCSMTAHPQIYTLVDHLGKPVYNTILHPNFDYIFKRENGGFMMLHATPELIALATNRKVPKESKYDLDIILFLVYVFGMLSLLIYGYFKGSI